MSNNLPSSADIVDLTTMTTTATATVSALAALPIAREPGWRASTTAANISRPVNREAALTQITGTVLAGAAACTKCQSGFGPFTECVVSTGRLKGACANCHWNSSGTRCPLRPAAAAKTTATTTTTTAKARNGVTKPATAPKKPAKALMTAIENAVYSLDTLGAAVKGAKAALAAVATAMALEEDEEQRLGGP